MHLFCNTSKSETFTLNYFLDVHTLYIFSCIFIFSLAKISKRNESTK
nr:MAG TPA: hypothetical protein [Caudoviricetes sp.]